MAPKIIKDNFALTCAQILLPKAQLKNRRWALMMGQYTLQESDFPICAILPNTEHQGRRLVSFPLTCTGDHAKSPEMFSDAVLGPA